MKEVMNMTNFEIAQIVVEEGYNMTSNIGEAIYLLTDGQMISGDFDYGIRGTDHRMIDILVDADRYDENEYWAEVHALGLVRLVPETGYALIEVGQELTAVQQEMLTEAGYMVEEY